jgi:hypothetical protein
MAPNLKGGRNHLDAEIRVSNVVMIYFEIGFARSSITRKYTTPNSD